MHDVRLDRNLVIAEVVVKAVVKVAVSCRCSSDDNDDGSISSNSNHSPSINNFSDNTGLNTNGRSDSKLVNKRRMNFLSALFLV